MRLGAVIVGYNSEGCLSACLDSCLRFSGELGEGIVVVDNASADGTRDVAGSRAGIRLIANRENRGFAAAVNQGFGELARADAVLILNPDVELLDPPSRLAAEVAEGVGAASGQLLGADGKTQAGFQVRRFPTVAALVFEILGINRLWRGNPVNRRYRCLDMDPAQAADVEQPAGACLMVRADAWRAVGGFDEGFHPLWFEDVDFLKRLVARGWRVRYAPGFRARHRGAHSLESVAWEDGQLYWYGSLLRYTSRHFQAPGLWMVCGAILLGLAPRTVTGVLHRGSSRPLAFCSKLVRLVFAYLRKGRAKARLPEGGSRAVVEDCGPSGS